MAPDRRSSYGRSFRWIEFDIPAARISGGRLYGVSNIRGAASEVAAVRNGSSEVFGCGREMRERLR